MLIWQITRIVLLMVASSVVTAVILNTAKD